MIEVEKKFRATDEGKMRLMDGAEFVNEKTFTDIYWDKTDFNLTRQDRWLRQRDDRWELKWPLHPIGGKNVLQQYDEIENEAGIREKLDLVGSGNFEEDLRAAGYAPVATLTTTRKKYKKGGFTIDLDEIDFGYAIGEIELMVNDEDEMAEAGARITAFAKDNGLDLLPVRGKVLEYLKRFSPSHYEALVREGVVWDMGD